MGWKLLVEAQPVLGSLLAPGSPAPIPVAPWQKEEKNEHSLNLKSGCQEQELIYMPSNTKERKKLIARRIKAVPLRT